MKDLELLMEIKKCHIRDVGGRQAERAGERLLCIIVELGMKLPNLTETVW